MASDEDVPHDQPAHPDGEPNFDRFGLVPLGVGSGRSMENAAEVISVISELLRCPVRYIDQNGYEHEITAGAIDPGIRAVAWVQCKSKTVENGHVDIEFRLKAEVESRPVIDWIVQTYNPYFGCEVRYMAWHDRWVVMVYREKHHIYACSHSLTGERQLVQLTDEWLVTATHITCRSEEPDIVDCLGLPDLHRLPPLASDDARQAGMLPPDYDRWNEWHKNYQRERNQSDKPMMSEPEWFGSLQPQKMLTFLRGKASDRKLRLFGVACCRRIWGELRDERSRRAVEIAEDFADNRRDRRALRQARQDAMTVPGAELQIATDVPRTAENLDALNAAYAAAEVANAAQQVAAEDAFQATAAVVSSAVYGVSSGEASGNRFAIEAGLLRDIFGNPFHPVTVESSWLTPTVQNLAAAIYEDRAFDLLPILADALEEAGCASQDILSHCRMPGEHVRGCWCLDALLGKS